MASGFVRKFEVTQYTIIFDDKRRLLLLKDNDKINGKWVFPGGHIDLEKDPIKALRRELHEELCMKLLKADVFTTAIKRYPSGKWKYVVYYKCFVEGNIKLSNEHSEYKWTSLKDFRNMKFRDRAEKTFIIGLLKG